MTTRHFVAISPEYPWWNLSLTIVLLINFFYPKIIDFFTSPLHIVFESF